MARFAQAEGDGEVQGIMLCKTEPQDESLAVMPDVPEWLVEALESKAIVPYISAEQTDIIWLQITGAGEEGVVRTDDFLVYDGDGSFGAAEGTWFREHYVPVL